MVIDSSALLAIAFSEEDKQQYIDAIASAFDQGERVYMPASVLVEAGIAAERRKFGNHLALVIESIRPEIVSLNEELAQLAVKAYGAFGKGLHKAGLNFGDCMSYATAHYLKSSLLYKGNDFKQTPVRPAL